MTGLHGVTRELRRDGPQRGFALRAIGSIEVEVPFAVARASADMLQRLGRVPCQFLEQVIDRMKRLELVVAAQ